MSLYGLAGWLLVAQESDSRAKLLLHSVAVSRIAGSMDLVQFHMRGVHNLRVPIQACRLIEKRVVHTS